MPFRFHGFMVTDYTRHKIRLIMYLRTAGIVDTRVLAAMEKVPREAFVPQALRDQAYEDMTLPIGRGQTISQPLVVSTMTQALEIGPRHKLLEIGTGSGYQTAILSHLCLRVYSIERHKPLLMQAERMFKALNLRNITAMAGDGMKGWPLQAPFDGIICTAAAPGKPPQALLDQLKPGGILVIPVALEGHQVLRRYKKEGEDTFAVRDLMPVRFVPLLPNLARESEQAEADPNLAYA